MRRRDTVLRALLLALLACAGPAARAVAQDVPPVVSKSDIRALFVLSKRQWQDYISRAVSTGVALRVPGEPLTMLARPPRAPVTIRLDYPRGDARPATVHVGLSVSAAAAPAFTEATTTQIVTETQRQLAPDYDVAPRVTQEADGGLTLHFAITDLARPPYSSQ
jgi:hypothetical protein